MDDTILYPSCFDANAGLFEALLGPEDAVISDELNHASIIDGIRLCKVGIMTVPRPGDFFNRGHAFYLFFSSHVHATRSSCVCMFCRATGPAVQVPPHGHG